MPFLYLNYPRWIHPQIFPNVRFLGLLRWYGLMYVFAFVTAYFFLRKQMREGALDEPGFRPTEDDLFSFIATGIIFLLIGARLGSTLIYDTTGLYKSKPWLIFWPFQNGHFTGLAGMSYHGGVVGGFIGVLVWCIVHKKNFLQWGDAIATAIPIGYTFGRLGNFLNGELYGRITTAPWGMVFPAAERFSTKFQWVQDFCAQIGMDITSKTMVNLPRHPSQLYEAFFEGIVTFVILWLLRKRKKFNGQMGWMYFGLYGIFRFCIEYFREPDADLGFRIGKDTSAPIYQNTSLLNFSTGQILCFIMIVVSSAAIIASVILLKKGNPKIQQILRVNNGYVNPELAGDSAKNQKKPRK